MVANLNHTTPLNPTDQQSKFAVGDALLVNFGEGDEIVIVGNVRVSEHWTLYALRTYDGNGRLTRSRCGIGEQALKAAFKSYVWWLS